MNSLVKTLILTFTLCFFSAIVFAENVALIKAVGNADLSDTSAELTAICDARSKAVDTVASKFIVNGHEELRRKLKEDYAYYIAGTPVVIKSEKIDGRLSLYCDFNVDVDKLHKAISDEQNRKEVINNNEIAVFVRVVYPEADTQVTYDINNNFHRAFGNIGITLKDANSMSMNISEKLAGKYTSYAHFITEMQKAVVNEDDVQLAIIGEMVVKNFDSSVADKSANVICNFELIRVSQDKNIVLLDEVNSKNFIGRGIDYKTAAYEAFMVGSSDISSGFTDFLKIYNN